MMKNQKWWKTSLLRNHWSNINNIVNNDYHRDSIVLYIFIPNKLFGQLLDTSPKHFLFFKTFNLEFSYFKQNSRPPEIEDKNITLVIK